MIFIEAENFDHLGGWVVDQQFMNQMGSPFLMAHGLGNPVADASTRFEVERTGIYHVWARTRDWAAPWKKPEQIATGKEEDCPGRFQVIINGEALQTVSVRKAQHGIGNTGVKSIYRPGSTIWRFMI